MLVRHFCRMPEFVQMWCPPPESFIGNVAVVATWHKVHYKVLISSTQSVSGRVRCTRVIVVRILWSSSIRISIHERSRNLAGIGKNVSGYLQRGTGGGKLFLFSENENMKTKAGKKKIHNMLRGGMPGAFIFQVPFKPNQVHARPSAFTLKVKLFACL